MSTFSAVSSTAERLDHLLLADGAPAPCEGDLRAGVLQLRSEIKLIENKLMSDENGRIKIGEEEKRRITQLAYDVEDAVESYAWRQAAAAADSKWKLGSVLKYPTARSLRKDLHAFSKRIDEIRSVTAGGGEGSPRSGVRSVVVVEPPPPPPAQILRTEVRSGGEDVTELTARLVGPESKLSVVAVCGMGGIGKTTLAQSVYNNRFVIEHFDTRAWAYVGQNFQARGILESVLSSLRPERSKSEIAAMEMMVLMDQLYKAQKGRRYLVVLDDVLSFEAWDTMRFAFPDDNNGSRIVITTQDEEVAKQMSTSVLEMKLLPEDRSWEILQSASGVMDGTEFNPEIEMVGKQIAKYCKGLPLAITVIGGILRKKNLKEWKEVLDVLVAGDGCSQETESVLPLSYNHLPLHLKPCFLYLGHFPEDEAIPVEKLYLLWMAEGLISTRALDNRTQKEVAEAYLKQLVDRSLVFVVENEVSDPTRFKSCQLHDLIRKLCISNGKQEEFFDVIDFGNGGKISSSSRRLVIYLYKFKDVNDDPLLNIRDARDIRSILFYDRDESHVKPASSSNLPRAFSDLTEFQGARVLHFDGVDFQVKKLPRGIQKLIYLRHLSFQGCHLKVFPSSFCSFPFLETLDLRVIDCCVMTIPNVLWKISSLRHLYFPLAFRVDTNDKLKLNTLKKLQVLENFNASLCDTNDLLQLENLQILSGVVEGNTDLKNIIGCMDSSKFLRHSSLDVKKFDSYSKERLAIVAELLECNGLHNLDFEGYLGVMPPHRNIGSNITSVVFIGSEFGEDPMPVFAKFPNLRSLVLCKDAFVGKKMVCSEPNHFLRLESLKLATLQYLEEWEVDEAAMPRLVVITIERCNKLEAIPSGLSEISTLERFMIGSMPKEFQEKVNQIIEKQRDNGNKELTVTFYDC
ncbi:hypothetical protein MIMGU_mgv1a001017mg [Erythranthe guttata]|uniref:Uncharacterized protein n=1 Tax=Erythranthe guttata TaxID=4155 RepID=A0A022PTY5_ERYGU|nr:PREDICTED: probable disease resistance RPP8-like protein 2 [Erythranthe guttata]EYU18283.1 hypothetical protein MIMGU_mgv1a001017mg [Erythranthe guttata]|eukprot:XP_012828600.1 PREDICTED: probable disease resistance RPP8-like protein 2 [Erythranthe guttata]